MKQYMTYRELSDDIEIMSEEKKNMTVTVSVNGEMFPIDCLFFTTDDQDILDSGHPVLKNKYL